MTALYNYQMGIFVDRAGQRFLDEGEDFRDHTYVKFSKFIVEQAGGEAWCVFDQKAYQREEFARAWRPVGPPLEADTLKELAEQMDMPAENLMDTVANFNAAIQPGEYDLDRLDGKRTRRDHAGEEQLGAPARLAAVHRHSGHRRHHLHLRRASAAIPSARVFDTRGQVMDGLYAAGEPMGEIFYYNYPGASSVIRGAVFGRIAGAHAAARA